MAAFLALAADLPAQGASLPPAVAADRAARRLERPESRGTAMMDLWAAGPEAVPALVRALRSRDDAVVEAACAVLYELGPEGQAARMHLQRLLPDATARRRRALQWALHGTRDLQLVLAEYTRGQITFLDTAGRATGMLSDLASIWDVQSLPGGRFLVAEPGSDRVREIDERGETLWQVEDLESPNRARRLWTGNTLIADFGHGRVVEVDPAGRIVWSFDKVQPTWVQRLLDGRTLIVDQRSDRLLEVDPGGEVRRSLRIANQVYGAERLRNGHTLVAERSAGRLVELDVDGQPVAEWKDLDSPNACLRLPDGSTLVAGAKGTVALDAAGKTLWRLDSPWVGGLSR